MSVGTPVTPNTTTAHPVAQVVQYITNAITVIALAYIANISSLNHDKIGAVEQRQETVVSGQQAAVVKADKVQTQLEQKIKEDSQIIGVQLYSTWRYLEDVAELSGAPKDKTKAAEARKLYDEHLRKNNKKSD